MDRVVIKNLTKSFKIRSLRKKTILERLTTISDIGSKRSLTVLKNISFTVKAGEMICIIGKNGSGKSTLLRIISEILEPDEGEIKTTGKIASLINLNTGLKDRMTMRDNIFLNCSLAGMKYKQIKQLFSSIVKFTDLEIFENIKLYQFSDGMRARLAFSIAVHSNPDIFLIDDVFAVGDEGFRSKCWSTLKKLQDKGVSIVIATHEIHMLKKYFPRVLWLDSGQVKMDGDGESVINKYLSSYKSN